jgi:protocatechuate 3,4-dioxygenase beta subunit
MKRFFSFAIVVLAASFCSFSYASEVKKVDLFSPMKQTPNTVISDDLSIPQVFETSNNLTRKAGSFEVATGEPLYIKGIVTDAFGVPITGASIRIWQTNAAGKYHTFLEEDSEYIDHNFNMSGEASTDNIGRYGFITIFPGFYDDRAPHINMIISHESFGKVETQMYFEGHEKNIKDPYYLAYTDEEKQMVTATVKYVDDKYPELGKVATFNITLDGVHQYKGF